jgi:hypothetical protein
MATTSTISSCVCSCEVSSSACGSPFCASFSFSRLAYMILNFYSRRADAHHEVVQQIILNPADKNPRLLAQRGPYPYFLL